MNFLKEIDRLHESTETYTTSYELFSDCRISGLANFGNGYLLCGIIAETNEDGDGHSYILKLKRATGVGDTMEVSKKGIDLHSSTEIISLMSLRLHARFYLHSTTTMELTDKGIPVRNRRKLFHRPFRFDKDFVKPDLFKGQENMTFINDFFEEVKKLKPEIHRNFIYAAYNYASGIRMIGIDDSIAYLKLIIALEILISDKEEINDELNKELEAIKPVLKKELSEEVGNFQKQRRIKHNLIEFIKNNKTDFISKLNHQKANPQITEENFEDYLSAIYKSRSRYIHEGRPMAISSINYSGNVLDFWEKSYMGSLVTTKDEIIPTVTFFESLVRHCLLEYFNKNLSTQNPTS